MTRRRKTCGGGVAGKAIASPAAAAASEADFKAAITSVWWQIDDNCPVPERRCDVRTIAKNIKSALGNLGYCDRISISGYCEKGGLLECDKRHLGSTGISLTIGGRSQTKMLSDLMIWALDHPAPANFLLISGDVDSVFSPALHHLFKHGYNILLAQPSCDNSLVQFAKTVWLWDDLLAGRPPIRSTVRILMKKKCTVTGGGEAAADYSTAKTSVWWDMEQCVVPRDCYDGTYFARNIKFALSEAGYRGPVSISAYGYNAPLLRYAIKCELESTLSLNPLTSGEKEGGNFNSKYSTDKKMIVEMVAWALDNAAPANIVLINVDALFSRTLEALRRKQYRILVGTGFFKACAPLVKVAKTAWSWGDLLSGQPPPDPSEFDE